MEELVMRLRRKINSGVWLNRIKETAPPKEQCDLFNPLPDEIKTMIIMGSLESHIKGYDLQLLTKVSICCKSSTQMTLYSNSLLDIYQGHIHWFPLFNRLKGLRFPFLKSLRLPLRCDPELPLPLNISSQFCGLKKLQLDFQEEKALYMLLDTPSDFLPVTLDTLILAGYRTNANTKADLERVFGIAKNVKKLKFNPVPELKALKETIQPWVKQMTRLRELKCGNGLYLELVSDTDLAKFIDNWGRWINENIPLASILDVALENWNRFALFVAIERFGGPLTFAALDHYQVTFSAKDISRSTKIGTLWNRDFLKWLTDPSRLSVKDIKPHLPIYLTMVLGIRFTTAILTVLRTELSDLDIWNLLLKQMPLRLKYDLDFRELAYLCINHLSVGLLEGDIPPLFLWASPAIFNYTPFALRFSDYSRAMLQDNKDFFEFLLHRRSDWNTFHIGMAQRASPRRFADMLRDSESIHDILIHEFMFAEGFNRLCACDWVTSAQIVAVIRDYPLVLGNLERHPTPAFFRQVIALASIGVMRKSHFSFLLSCLPNSIARGSNLLFFLFSEAIDDGYLNLPPSSDIGPLGTLHYLTFEPYKYETDHFGRCPLYYWLVLLRRAGRIGTGPTKELRRRLKELIVGVYGDSPAAIPKHYFGVDWPFIELMYMTYIKQS